MYPQIERLYNAVTATTARKLAGALRRRGYRVRRERQWVFVFADSFDMVVSQIIRRYDAIAY